MIKLIEDYKKTAETLYTYILSYKKNQQNNSKYCLLVLEYQHTCAVLRQMKNYCKARGLI